MSRRRPSPSRGRRGRTGGRAARSDRRRRPVALTGTPGAGKSTVARLLADRWRVREVAELALETGTGRRRGNSVEVDVRRLRAACLRGPAGRDVDLVVGHLAHLLPVRETIVLRCHPLELGRRLARARRGSRADRAENVLAEALDLVLAEAVRRGRPVYEIDTSGRSVRSVARAVDRRLRRGGRSRVGAVAWLADRTVTEHLLEPAA